jgi:hypothetical protein
MFVEVLQDFMHLPPRQAMPQLLVELLENVAMRAQSHSLHALAFEATIRIHRSTGFV